jgi:hypothetical protein
MFLKENIIHKNTFNYLTFLEDVINFNEEYTEIKDKIIQLEYNKVLEESILLEASSLWQKVIEFFKYLWKKILEFKNFIVSLYRKAKDWILKKFKKGDKVEVTINEATKKAEEAVKQAEDILKTQEASKEDLNRAKENLKKVVSDLDDKQFEKAQTVNFEFIQQMIDEENRDKANSDSLANSIKAATIEAEHLASSNDNEKIEISREKINLGNEALKTQNKVINKKIKTITSTKPVTIDGETGEIIEDEEDFDPRRVFDPEKSKKESDIKMKDIEKEHEQKMKKMKEDSNKKKEEKIKEVMNDSKLSDTSKEILIKNIRKTM